MIHPASRGAKAAIFSVGTIGVAAGVVAWFVTYREFQRKNKKSEIPMRSVEWEALGDVARYALSGSTDDTGVTSVCPSCKEALSGDGPFVTLEGQLWHPQCVQCPTCAAFHEAQGGDLFVVVRDNVSEAVCARHFADETNAINCDATGKAFRIGEPTTVTPMGEVVCSSLSGAAPCFSCRRPLVGKYAEGSVPYADGRQVCSKCLSTAVQDSEGARYLMTDIRTMLGTDFGIDTGGAEITIQLGELEEGRKLYQAGKPGDISVGHVCVEGMTLQKYYALQVGSKLVQKREVKGLYLLSGMSRMHAAKVLAHELTHVYLALNKYNILPLEVEEGICQLVSYLWLAEQVDRYRDQVAPVPRRAKRAEINDAAVPDFVGNEEEYQEAMCQLRRMEDDMNPVYGIGFRKAHAALQGRSLDDLLAHVKEHKSFPAPRLTGNQGQPVKFLARGSGGGSPGLPRLPVPSQPEYQANVAGDTPFERLAGSVR